jgi:L-seryl-tRNA(Ser) seleniumtransferase
LVLQKDNTENVYERLGVRPVINAWGVATELGGWTPTNSVQAAMNAANSNQVEMLELLSKSGDLIAEMLGCEAAYITSGAGAAQALGIAALMAGRDPDKILQLPDNTGLKNEVIIQKRNRYMFDRCYTFTGARLVEAGDQDATTKEQLEGAIGPTTVALAYYLQPPLDESIVSLAEMVEIGRSKGVPVILDACSQIYPLDYFKDNAQSADLVTFGAKYMGAPHSTGFICGKRELIEAVAAQSFVAFHYDGSRAVGRAMKVDRQEIIGVVTALEDWFTMNHEDRIFGYETRFESIVAEVESIYGVTTQRVEHPHYVPYVLNVVFDSEVLGKTAEQVRAELDACNPRIWVGASISGGKETINIVVHTMNEGEAEIVAKRLANSLGKDQ